MEIQLFFTKYVRGVPAPVSVYKNNSLVWRIERCIECDRVGAAASVRDIVQHALVRTLVPLGFSLLDEFDAEKRNHGNDQNDEER